MNLRSPRLPRFDREHSQEISEIVEVTSSIQLLELTDRDAETATEIPVLLDSEDATLTRQLVRPISSITPLSPPAKLPRPVLAAPRPARLEPPPRRGPNSSAHSSSPPPPSSGILPLPRLPSALPPPPV